MTRGLSDDKAKWLTYLVYILLTLMGIGLSGALFVVAYNTAEISKIKDGYVQKEQYRVDIQKQNERYTCDMGRLERHTLRIENKVDRLLLRPNNDQ